jgi:predicted kinase
MDWSGRVGSEAFMLIIFAGLPGVGKSTIARSVAQRLDAIWLRSDTIDQPIMAVYGDDIADLGYKVAHGVARDNLKLGRTVVADCVNDLAITRDPWRAVATDLGIAFLEIEVVCSDKTEHRRRVENRVVDIPGLKLPTWAEIMAMRAEPWSREHVEIDTAGRDMEDCLAQVLASLNQQRGNAS